MAVTDAAQPVPGLPGREARRYRAVVSTAAVAQGWARSGAPHGAVVVADHQLAPRGWDGRLWPSTEQDLGFSVILRRPVPTGIAGWLYLATGVGLADALGPGEARISWPDRVEAAGTPVRFVVDPGGAWCVVSVLIGDGLVSAGLRACVEAIDDAAGRDREEMRDRYAAICSTLGWRVTARLVPLGPAGRVIEGIAEKVNPDGALAIATGDRRIAVLPEAVGSLELEGV